MEIWKPTHIEHYHVSSHGRVKNVKTNNILTQCNDYDKSVVYFSVKDADGKRKNQRNVICNLVARAFLEFEPNSKILL